jgi:predicted MPP superfamily phosphohydrolase
MRRWLAVPAVAFGAGVAGVGYAVAETRMFRLRRVEVGVLAPGSKPLKVLHISDLHLTPAQRIKQRWVRGLAELEPDLVVGTGDFIAHPEAVPALIDTLGDLLAKPGCFVLGSNDYYAPKLKDPSRYLRPDTGKRVHGTELPWRDLVTALTGEGWVDLSNARGWLKADGREIELRGVDDSHIGRDEYDVVSGPADPTADLRLGVMHSPEPSNVSAMAHDGFELVLAGHTHGGQLRVPYYGALVTNCGLDRSRARGLSQWDERSWLHVSAGLGTSPYAPVRFSCPPEATLLTLVAAR